MAMTWMPGTCGKLAVPLSRHDPRVAITLRRWNLEARVRARSPLRRYDGDGPRHHRHLAGRIAVREGGPEGPPYIPEHLESRKAAIADERNGAPARSVTCRAELQLRQRQRTTQTDARHAERSESIRRSTGVWLHAVGRRLATHQRTGVGAGPAAGADTRRTGRDHTGQRTAGGRRPFTGTAWSSTATTTAFTASAGSDFV